MGIYQTGYRVVIKRGNVIFQKLSPRFLTPLESFTIALLYPMIYFRLISVK
nr:MAG TPA: hypothetical protein [Caudoviricetes sp.]